nr:hypothetical protein GCM10020093_072700 [Planobispora longispora]
MVQQRSKVFPELSKVRSISVAQQVLKARTGRAVLDRELLAAWLNWAHGAYGDSTRVSGKITFKSVVASAEKQRLNRGTTSAAAAKTAQYLVKTVNRAR